MTKKKKHQEKHAEKDEGLYFQTIEVPEYGIYVSIEAFLESIEKDPQIQYNKRIYLGFEDKMTNILAKPEDIINGNIPKWTTHIVWFNN